MSASSPAKYVRRGSSSLLASDEQSGCMQWWRLGSDVWRSMIFVFLVTEIEIDAVCREFQGFLKQARSLVAPPEKQKERLHRNSVPRLLADFLTKNAQPYLQAVRLRNSSLDIRQHADGLDFLVPIAKFGSIPNWNKPARRCEVCYDYCPPGLSFRFVLQIRLPVAPLLPAPILRNRITAKVFTTHEIHPKTACHSVGIEVMPDFDHVCYSCWRRCLAVPEDDLRVVLRAPVSEDKTELILEPIELIRHFNWGSVPFPSLSDV